VLIMVSDEVDVHSTASVLAVALSSTVSCAVPGGNAPGCGGLAGGKDEHPATATLIGMAMVAAP
jgi:hypothetical protein